MHLRRLLVHDRGLPWPAMAWTVACLHASYSRCIFVLLCNACCMHDRWLYISLRRYGEMRATSSALARDVLSMYNDTIRRTLLAIGGYECQVICWAAPVWKLCGSCAG